VDSLQPTGLAQLRVVDEVRPHLTADFRHLTDEDLSWLGMWVVCRKAR
jgi:hypothetical protein